ncbi:putative Concanavalin A-like lectin/glucanase [Seiridium cardinale]
MKRLSFLDAWIVLTLVSNLATSASIEYATTTDSKCGCYLTNTTAQNFFSRHMFFDFRNKQQYVNVAQPLEDPAANTQAGVTSSYFDSGEWKDSWEIQNWNKSARLNGTSDGGAAILMINTANNIYFERNNDTRSSANTYLTLRTVRHEKFQSAAEFDSVSGDYHYISMRMLARTRGAGGAVTAMFTYRGADGANNVQEADLEVRTSDPNNVIQYTNQPSNHNVTGSTQNVTLPARLRWSDWQYHRVDWTPGSSTWFVNGLLVSRITSQAPRDPSRILFNAWSDGGSWSGNMPIGSEAYLQIQWIDMVYNNTDTSIGLNKNARNGRCGSVCSIDQTRTVGTPVLILGDGSGGNYSTQSPSSARRAKSEELQWLTTA